MLTYFKRKMSSKVGCFAGFYHHRLVTIIAHTYACCYLLFESETKTGSRTIALCRKDRVQLAM